MKDKECSYWKVWSRNGVHIRGLPWQLFSHWFPDERDWRINPYRLHVVAYVQDAESGEILQAAMVPINDWSNGKHLVLP